MVFEIEVVDAPDPLPIDFQYDRERGRVLLKTPEFSNPGYVDLRLTTDKQSMPWPEAEFTRLEVRGARGRDGTLFSESLRDFDVLNDWFYSLQFEDGPRTIDLRIPIERGQIVGQYEDGEYEDVTPTRDAELQFVVGQKEATAPATFDIPDNARVKENTTIRNISLSVDGTVVSPEAEFSVRAGHAVDLPVTVTASVGDTQVASEQLEIRGLTGSIRGSGGVISTSLPSFVLNGIPYQTNQIRYRVSPREWGVPWIDPVEATVGVPNISVNDVSITGCRVTPEQVVAGEQVTVRSSVINSLPVAVDVKGQIDFAGSQATFSRQIGAGEVAPVTKTFRTTEPGTAQPEIRLTSVGGNV